MDQRSTWPRMERGPLFLSIVSLCLFLPACASVDVILLTRETFPPKGSADDVAVLQEMPVLSHQEIAELRIGDSRISFGALQRKILKQAASLGADAVVFSIPESVTQRRVALEPMYGPWGFNSPYYYGSPWGYGGYGWYGGFGGPLGMGNSWGGTYSGSMAIPYDETVNMLMGIAIRYTSTRDLGSRTESSAVQKNTASR